MTDNQQSTTNTSTVTTPAEREIHIERVFNAPRERVFAAFTDPELIPQWWGPHGTTTVVDQIDVRPGGTWRFVSQDSDGSEVGFRGDVIFHTNEERDGMLSAGMEKGMNESFERLDELLAA